MRSTNTSRRADSRPVMITRDDVEYAIVAKEINKSYKLISIRVKDTKFVALYIKIDADIAEFIENEMDRIQGLIKGWCGVVGELNSKQSSWCHDSNPKGNRLVG